MSLDHINTMITAYETRLKLMTMSEQALPLPARETNKICMWLVEGFIADLKEIKEQL